MNTTAPAALTAAQEDRVAGVLVGAACGDALGVPYEFAVPPAPGQRPVMSGGGLGPYQPGEYSDDTQMAVCIAQVTAAGEDLNGTSALDAVARGFLIWRQDGASDVGAQTSAVLAETRRAVAVPGAEPHLSRLMAGAAAGLHARTGRSAGNGSLMRTAVIGLAYLDDLAAMACAARRVSELTHFDDLAGDACVLWCAAIRRAVLDGSTAGLRADGLPLIEAGRRVQWARWLDEAEHSQPERFSPNGYVVPALQAAWSAVTSVSAAGRDRADAFADGITAAVSAGHDTDTVAAIAGALLGAIAGLTGIPAGWSGAVHGWPGLGQADLVRLARRTAGLSS